VLNEAASEREGRENEPTEPITASSAASTGNLRRLTRPRRKATLPTAPNIDLRFAIIFISIVMPTGIKVAINRASRAVYQAS
jgi:hypothetical protein